MESCRGGGGKVTNREVDIECRPVDILCSYMTVTPTPTAQTNRVVVPELIIN